MKNSHSKFVINKISLDLTKDHLGRTFKGEIRIEGQKLGRPSQRIMLHQDGLKITHAEITHITKQGKTAHELARINHLKKRGEVRLHAKTTLYPGQYVLQIEYEGRLTREIDDEVFGHNELHITDLTSLNLDKVILKNLIPHIDYEEQ